MSNTSPPIKKKKSSAGTAATAGQKNKKLYDVQFFHAWCKQCGLCIAFCPKQIIRTDENGKPEIIDADLCTGCRFCELHCPDFAITIQDRVPRRRKTDE